MSDLTLAILTLDGRTDNRGFTGHEMLDQLDLVHMNGRVYDPRIGRFMSGDPLIADLMNGQNYNRYSYVSNNPTNLTDPTGFLEDAGDSKESSSSRLTLMGGGGWKDPLAEDSGSNKSKSPSAQGAAAARGESQNKQGHSANNDKSLINTVKDGMKTVANTIGTNDEGAEVSGRKIADELGLPKYDRNDDAYHSYGHVTQACALAQKGCSSDTAAYGLLYGAAPGQATPAVPGETKEQSLIGGNQIVQFAMKDKAVVVNMTDPNHWMRDGFVVRWVGVQKGYVNIYTYGEGKNINVGATMFNYAAGYVFKYSDWNIRQQLELRIRETPQK